MHACCAARYVRSCEGEHVGCPSPIAALFSLGERARDMSRRDLPCLKREETAVQGDDSHGNHPRYRDSDVGRGRQTPAEDPWARQITRARGSRHREEGTARHGKGTSSPAALAAMAQISGPGRCNISQLGACVVGGTVGRSSAEAALLQQQQSEGFRYGRRAAASACVGMGVGGRGR